MKQLTILRHAKADDPTLYDNDFDRPLTDRGRKDVRAISRVVESLPSPFDMILSSPSARTKQTTEELLASITYNGPVVWADKIYDATPKNLLCVLKELPANIDHVLLVGHNTGLEDLITGLCSGASPYFNFRLATAGLVHIELDLFRWDQIRWGCGSLYLLMNPKMLRRYGRHVHGE